jgi:DNA-binding MarR family transcriptional regulator
MIDGSKVWELRFRVLARAADMELSPGALRVLTNLLLRFNVEDGACWPRIATIARDVGISTRTVSRALSQLEAAGLLTIESRVGTSSRFRPVFECVEDEIGSMPGAEPDY